MILIRSSIEVLFSFAMVVVSSITLLTILKVYCLIIIHWKLATTNIIKIVLRYYKKHTIIVPPALVLLNAAEV